MITVKDSGIGLPADANNRIFDLFVQLDANRSGGLGIGLNLTRSIVEMHGGQVEAQSAGPDQGATFTVRLPLAARAEAEARAAPMLSGPPKAIKRRVLVVDDNADAADSLALLLSMHGSEVQQAYDAQRALDIARTFKPEVAFVDLNMPGMNGSALAAALRAEPWASGLRLIAVTGMGQKSDIEGTRAAGFHAHLTKPAVTEEILRLAEGASANVVPLHGEREAS